MFRTSALATMALIWSALPSAALAASPPPPNLDCDGRMMPPGATDDQCHDLCTYDATTAEFVCDFSAADPCDSTGVKAFGTNYPNSSYVTVFGTCDTQLAFCCQAKVSIPVTMSADHVVIIGTPMDDYISLNDVSPILENSAGGARLAYVGGKGGNDEIHGSNSHSSSYEEELDGGEDCDLIYGHDGDDILRTGGGGLCLEDVAKAGAGDDTVVGGTSNGLTVGVILHGDEGEDVLIAHATTPTTIFGGDDADTILGSNQTDNLHGDSGNDRIEGKGGIDFIFGGSGDDDIIVIGSQGSEVEGEDGNDRILGGDGDDWIWGGPGADTIHGGDGEDRIDGGTNNDKIFGGPGKDKLAGGSGTDFLCETQFPVATFDTLYGDLVDLSFNHIPDPTNYTDRAWVQTDVSAPSQPVYWGANDVEWIYQTVAMPWGSSAVKAPGALIFNTNGIPSSCATAMNLPVTLF